MKRYQAFEFCDQPWLPDLLRDLFNDAIGFTHHVWGPYKRLAPHLSAWAAALGADEILDIGSAGAEHLRVIINRAKNLERDKASVNTRMPRFLASDLYPVSQTWRNLQSALGPEQFGFISEPVSAINIPQNAPRCWTIFTALHHFPPPMARQFLQHFTEHSDGLCIAEYYHRGWYGILMTILAVPTNLLVPFFAARPTWEKFALGFLFPIAQLTWLVDGISSVLRTYTSEEIIAMMPEECRDQFTITQKKIWYGLAPMRAQIIFITRKSAQT